MYPTNPNNKPVGQTFASAISEIAFKAPFFGAIHWGAMRVAVIRTTTTALSFKSYVLMHVIGTTASEGVKALGNLAHKVVGDREATDKSIVRKCVWTVIEVPLFVAETVDLAYSKVFHIHTLAEAKKMQPRELCMTEVMREVFLKHVGEQFLYIFSWEIGKRGAELLLKNTILTFMPSTKTIYAMNFVFKYVMSVVNFRAEVLKEQKEELKEIFEATETIIEYYNKLGSNVDEDFNIDTYSFTVNLFEKEVNNAIDIWKYYPSSDLDELTLLVDRYKMSIVFLLESQKEKLKEIFDPLKTMVTDASSKLKRLEVIPESTVEEFNSIVSEFEDCLNEYKNSEKNYPVTDLDELTQFINSQKGLFAVAE